MDGQRSEDQLESITGTLDRIKYTNDDDSWAVAEIRVAASAGRHRAMSVTVVGNLMGAWPGEELHLKGVWRKHVSFGQQFVIKHTITEAPVTQEGMERYLAHSRIEGVGPVLAGRLVEHFGPDTLDVIEDHPERLTEVEGIGKVRVKKISEAWQAKQGERRITLFLLSHGLTPAYAARVKKAYGEDAVEEVKRNPYAMAQKVFGIGFKMADRVAEKLGIRGDDPRRVRAGLLQVLVEAQSEGHLYLPLELLVERSADYLKVGEGQLSAGIETMERQGLLVNEPVTKRDDTRGLGGHLAVFSRRSWEAERDCTDELKRLKEARPEATFDEDESFESLMDETEAELGVALAPLQRQAILMAFAENLVVITGGPGTGKTTLVRAVCHCAKAMGWQTRLAAPTGRAAKRLSEATGQEASTLHRLLEFSFKAGGFVRGKDNPVEADLIVVDEVSMVDIHLMKALSQAVETGCRVVLVGDVDQLPSVGPGDVLADLIRSKSVPVCRLETVFRQSETSAIVSNAHLINEGRMPEQSHPRDGELLDFYIIRSKDAEDLRDKLLRVVTKRIPDAFDRDPMREVQVIAPMHRGSVGCMKLNEALQQALNPGGGQEIRRGERIFRRGDRVMQLRNNYEKEVFNGDVGNIARVIPRQDEDPAKLEVLIDDRLVVYEYDELDELNLAYAITAHKSQGSEYPVVVIALATAHYVLLERNLLYTALTRARSLAVLIVMDQALKRAVQNVSARKRYTRLAHRLAGA